MGATEGGSFPWVNGRLSSLLMVAPGFKSRLVYLTVHGTFFSLPFRRRTFELAKIINANGLTAGKLSPGSHNKEGVFIPKGGGARHL